MIRTQRPDDAPRFHGCEWADVRGDCPAQARWRHTWTTPLNAHLHTCDRHSASVHTANTIREVEIDR